MLQQFGRRALAGVVLATLTLSGCSVVADVVAPTGQPSVSANSAPASNVAPTAGEGSDPRLATFYQQRLSWTPCGGDFQCTTLSVPRSYDDPEGDTLAVRVIRLPAANGDERIGSLVLNPGGPGGSGIDYARAARAVTTEAVRERYDIVGFDPRGVGTSDPIECMSDEQTDEFIAADASPDSPAEVDTLARLSKQLGATCKQRTPELVEHVGTIDAARDIDILRAALGDSTLHYLGKSYGTFLGATYADLFPTSVGRMVLDGAIDPSIDGVQLSKQQAAGFELSLRRFAEACPTFDDCPLSTDPDTAVRQVVEFFAAVDRQPLPTDQGRPLTEALAVLGVIGSLYDAEYGWPELSAALAAAFNGDGSTLLNNGDLYTDRESDGSYSSNANDAIYAVNCWDKPATPGVAESQRLAAEWDALYPAFGEYLAWGSLPCATWPGHSSVPPHPISAPGSPPILVVGTTYDPATPVEWARALAGQLSSGVYLEWNGDGHTAYQRGSSCIDDAVDAYLLDGTPPADGTVCD